MAEYQVDAEEVLIPTSDAMVNEIANYRATVDGLMARVEEASTTAIVGPMGNALVAKVGEFQATAHRFLEELERIAHAVSTFGNQAIEAEEASSAHAESLDVELM